MPIASSAALERTLAHLIQVADEKYRMKTTTADGHFAAATNVMGGYRYSVRYNRHGRREVSVSNKTPGEPIPSALLDEISDAHTTIVGVGLKVAYTEPRNFADGKDDELAWAVLHPGGSERQNRLIK